MSELISRKAFDGISASINDVSRSLVENRRQSVSAIDELGSSLTNAIAVQTVDLLTDEEVDELRSLIEIGDDFVEQPVPKSKRGMYVQLCHSGFIECLQDVNDRLILIRVSPKAGWAVNRHDMRKAREAAKAEEDAALRAEERRFDRKMMLEGFALGFLSGVAAPLIVDGVRFLLGLS